MKKRILSAVMSLALIFGLMPTAFAAGDTGTTDAEGTQDDPASSNVSYKVETNWDKSTWKITQNITITIPEGMSDQAIELDALNGEASEDLKYAFGSGLWAPGDSATINIKVVNESGNNYIYKEGSADVGTREFDISNTGTIVYRTYNSALSALLKAGKSSSDQRKAMTDANLETALIAAGYANGIDDLDDYYCDFYKVEDLSELTVKQLNDLFGGNRANNRESNADVAKLGWTNLYTNLFTINGYGILQYTEDSQALFDLRNNTAAVITDGGYAMDILLDGPGTGNAYQGHDIYFNLRFALELQRVALVYDANYGDSPITSNAGEFNAGTDVAISDNMFERVGYKFTGWNTEPDGSGVAYTPASTLNLTQDTTLYAQWEELPEVTISPVSVVAYVGGDSANGSHAPKLRFSVAIDSLTDSTNSTDSVDSTESSESADSTADEAEKAAPENTKEQITEVSENATPGVLMLADSAESASTEDVVNTSATSVKQSDLTFTMHANNVDTKMSSSRVGTSDDAYWLFPMLDANMNVGENNADEFSDDPKTIQRGDFLVLTDDDNNPDTFAGVYTIDKRTSKYGEYGTGWYITVEDTQGNTYIVNLDTGGATVTIRQVSDRDGMYASETVEDSGYLKTNVEDDDYLTAVVTDIEQAFGEDGNVADSSEFIAVVPEETTFETNGDSSLGVISYKTQDNSNGVNIELKDDVDSANIALLTDNLVSMGTGFSTEDDLHANLIQTAQSRLNTSYSSWNKAYRYLDLVNTQDGNAVMTANNDVTVYWPYSEIDGVTAANASKYTFQILHFKNLDRDYTVKGEDVDPLNDSVEIETLQAVATDYGVKFETSSFSPFVLLWETKAQGNGGNPGGGTEPDGTPDTPDVPDTPDTPDDPADTPDDPENPSGLVQDAFTDTDPDSTDSTGEVAGPADNDGHGLVQDAFYDDGTDSTSDGTPSANNGEGVTEPNNSDQGEGTDLQDKPSQILTAKLAQTGDTLGYTACGLGIVALLAAGALCAMMARAKRPAHQRKSPRK